MLKEIHDDEVLQAMTLLEFDVEALDSFRAVRRFMREGMPLCCIDFTILMQAQPLVRMEKAGRWYKHEEEHSLKYAVGKFSMMIMAYWLKAFEAAHKEGIELNYIPCPACLLNKNFIQRENICACCADEEEHPSA